MKFRKLTELPDEYIVKCGENFDKCKKVRTYYYGRSTICSWEYIICKKDIGKYSGLAIEDFIRKEYKHLPVFTFEQWEQLKQQTENLNKMENKTVNSIEIPKGWEFDRIENGTIKLKEITKKPLTHEEILDADSGKIGFRLIGNEIIETMLRSDNKTAYSIGCISKKDAVRGQAFIAIMRIANYYNKNYANGWVADWKDSSQAKWSVRYEKSFDKYTLIPFYSISQGSSAFATKELTQLALDNNREIFDNLYK